MKRILEVKKKIGTLSKQSKNPFFKSSYLDLNGLLDAIEPLLWEQDLLLIQPIRDNKVCSIIMDEEGKTLLESCIELPNITDPQKLGSCITYFRRYTLKSLFAISEVDDDAELTRKKAEPKKPLENKPALIVNSKPFHGGISKKTPIKEMSKYFEISEDVKTEYSLQFTEQ